MCDLRLIFILLQDYYKIFCLGWVQLLLKLFGKLCKSDESNASLNFILIQLINEEFHFRILKFLPNAFKKK